MLYKVKMTPAKAKGTKLSNKSNEVVLKDLLTVLPTLRKHKLQGEIETKVRTLRNGRKNVEYNLEISRPLPRQLMKPTSVKDHKNTITLSEKLTKQEDKISVLRKLRDMVKKEIQQKRKENLPPVEVYRHSTGVEVKKLAEVYLEHNHFLAVQMKKVRVDMTRGKRPTTGDGYIGVEIELASTKDRNFICDRLFEAGVGKHICVKDDGSIGRGARDGRDTPSKLLTTHKYAHEITILVKQSDYKTVLATICKVLNEQCDVKVDATCGLHVHIDMRGKDHKKAFHNLVSMQQFLYAMNPVARRNSRYSYPIKGTEWRDADRYHGINMTAYAKYQTLEARMHCGTTQGDKIINWVALILAMCEAPKVAKAPTTIAELQAAIGIDNNLCDYINSRIQKFAGQHKGAKYVAEQPGTMPEINHVMTSAVDATVVEESEVA